MSEELFAPLKIRESSSSGGESGVDPAERIGVRSPVVAVVVTYNRKALLVRCLEALLTQDAPCDIAIVDNASTDGTKELLAESGLLGQPRIHYLRLVENIGGAGGFHRGVQFALSMGWEWLWLMDDDSLPRNTALGRLLEYASRSDDVYASVALGTEDGFTRLSTPTAPVSGNGPTMMDYDELSQPVVEVSSLPFVGFFIHRDLASRIGPPRPDLFIYWDDLEYTMRSRRAGARTFLVRDSVIDHPLPPRRVFRFLGRDVVYRSLPPWKVYFDARNKIIVTREYQGVGLLPITVAGILLRAFRDCLFRSDPLKFIIANGLGCMDGILNRPGLRAPRSLRIPLVSVSVTSG